MFYATEIYKEISCTAENLLKKNKISHELLWILYKSEDILYTLCFKINRLRAVRLVNGNVTRSWSFQLDCRDVDYNDTTLDEAALQIFIPFFESFLAIDSLEVFPLKYHKFRANIRQSLLLQENRFLSLRECHHVHYVDLTISTRSVNNVSKVVIESKIMIDFKIYHDKHISLSFLLFPLSKKNLEWCNVRKCHVEVEVLSESSKIICSSLVRDYCLNDQQWCMRNKLLTLNAFTDSSCLNEFDVDKIQKIQWSSKLWDFLVMPDSRKKLILDLTQNVLRNMRQSHSKNIIRNKREKLKMILA